MSRNVDEIWANIIKFQGEIFWTKTRKSYTYEAYDDYILINNLKSRRITKEQIGRALFIDNPTPQKIGKENIWGPSYVYGIISDERIK